MSIVLQYVTEWKLGVTEHFLEFRKEQLVAQWNAAVTYINKVMPIPCDVEHGITWSVLLCMRPNFNFILDLTTTKFSLTSFMYYVYRDVNYSIDMNSINLLKLYDTIISSYFTQLPSVSIIRTLVGIKRDVANVANKLVFIQPALQCSGSIDMQHNLIHIRIRDLDLRLALHPGGQMTASRGESIDSVREFIAKNFGYILNGVFYKNGCAICHAKSCKLNSGYVPYQCPGSVNVELSVISPVCDSCSDRMAHLQNATSVCTSWSESTFTGDDA